MYVCYLQKSGVGAQKYITSKIKHGHVITVFVCLFVFPILINLFTANNQ